MLQKSLKTPPPKFFLDFMLTKIPTVLSMINKDFLIFFYLKNKSFALVAVEPNLYLFLEYCSSSSIHMAHKVQYARALTCFNNVSLII